MKKLIKYGIGLALTAIIGIGAHIFYLYSLRPTEKFPEDTYLKSVTKKTALIIVAHDDDATLFSGTTSMLAATGWDISFVCFYTDLYKPEVNPIRKQEMQNIQEIEGLKNLELIDFRLRRRLDTVKKGYLPIPYDEFSENFEIDSLRMYIFQAIEKYQPTIVFTLDDVIGFYGNPEHVLVSQTVVNICREYKDSTDFSVKRIYQCVWPYSQAEKIMKNIPTYHKGKKIYVCDGMPAPDVEIDISSFGSTKKKVLAAHASQHNNIKRYIKYYHYYPAWLYFSIFNKEYYKVTSVD